MPASASGVSNTRRSPNRAASPSVTRKTPPSVPTSSPNTTTRSSAARLSASAWLSAAAIVTGAAAGAAETTRISRRGHNAAHGAGSSSSASSLSSASSVRPLPLKRGRRLGVHVLEELGRIDADVGVHPLPDVLGQPLRLRRQPGGRRVVQQPGPPQVGLQPGDRVARKPPADLRRRPVAGGVVGVGVRLDPVGERLDQRGAVAGRRPRHPGPHRRVDRGGVVAVDEQRRDAVADPLRGQRRRRRLLRQRHADRVPVVLHQEHHRGLPHAGEVERLVGVALAGRAVAEQRQRHLVLVLQRGRVREADRVQGVGRQRGALRRDPVLVGVVAAVPVAAQQREGLLGGHAAGQHRHRVAVGRKQPVLAAQRERGPDLAGVLAAGGRVDREPALLGQRGRLAVEAAPEHHPPVQLNQHLRPREAQRPRVVTRMPVGVDQLQWRRARQQVVGGRRFAAAGVLGLHGRSLQQRSFPENVPIRSQISSGTDEDETY